MGLYGFIGEDKLPNYIGIIIIWDYIINHDIRIPSLTNQDSMESRRFFFVAQLFNVQVVKYMVVTHTHTCVLINLGPSSFQFQLFIYMIFNLIFFGLFFWKGIPIPKFKVAAIFFWGGGG